MTLATDIARDWAVMDGIVDVSLRPQNPDGTPITGAKALQRQVTHRDISLAGTLGVEPFDTVWHVWNARAVGSTDVIVALTRDLRNGDLMIQADGSQWEIRTRVYSPQTGRWRCLCTKRN